MNIIFTKIAEAVVADPGPTTLAGTNINCSAGLTSLTGLINFFTCTLMDAVVPLLMALAMAAFVFGIIKYFLNPDNEEKRKEGKGYMFWGLISIFVMVSIWGLVGILSNTFLEDSPGVIPSLQIKN